MTPDLFPAAFELLIGHEGGYQNDPDDKGNWTGGEKGQGQLKGTKYGISAASYPDLDIQGLTLGKAASIYRRDYWNKVGAADLPAPLALVAFDAAVHSGPGRALAFLRKTRDWSTFLDLRLDFIREIGSVKYAQGWENRIAKLRIQAQTWEDSMGEKTDRQLLLEAALKVVRGSPLKRYSTDTIHEGGRCAQLVRETVEGTFGLEPNKWEVAQLAFAFQYKAERTERWAKDYRDAARQLGLHKPASQMRGGDILYWPYTSRRTGKAYWHTAMYLGEVNGVPCVLENSDWKPAERRKMGALTPLGANTYVYVSPLSLFPAPETVITPTTAILRAEAARPVQAPPPVAPTPDPVTYLWVPVLNLDGKPEPGLVSVPVDRGGRLLVQQSGLPKLVRVPAEKAAARGGK